MAEGDLRELKDRMDSVSSIEHLTRAMSLVSTAKLQTSRLKLMKTRKHFEVVTNSIEEIFQNTEDIESPYLNGSREIENHGYIVISSSRGLCGTFNERILDFAMDNIGEKEHSVLYGFGSRCIEHFLGLGYTFSAAYDGPPEDIKFLDIKMVCEPMIEQYKNGEIDALSVIFTEFHTSLNQQPAIVDLLPFQTGQQGEIPRRKQLVDYEPSEEEIFNYLVPKYVEIMLFKAVLESVVSENASRMMAMQTATDNAQDMIENLTLSFNQARQRSVTQQITEISGGAEALRGK